MTLDYIDNTIALLETAQKMLINQRKNNIIVEFKIVETDDIELLSKLLDYMPQPVEKAFIKRHIRNLKQKLNVPQQSESTDNE